MSKNPVLKVFCVGLFFYITILFGISANPVSPEVVNEIDVISLEENNMIIQNEYDSDLLDDILNNENNESYEIGDGISNSYNGEENIYDEDIMATDRTPLFLLGDWTGKYYLNLYNVHRCPYGYVNYQSGTAEGISAFCIPEFTGEIPAPDFMPIPKTGKMYHGEKGFWIYRCTDGWVNAQGDTAEGISAFCLKKGAETLIKRAENTNRLYKNKQRVMRCQNGWVNTQSNAKEGIDVFCIQKVN